MAQRCYPTRSFEVASGDDLPFASGEFDVVISGCVLLHCPNYMDHIAETARVTKRSIVLARTPVSKRQPTRFFTKKAYGIETVEIVFNEAEIVDLVQRHGFTLTHYIVLDSDESHDLHTVTYAFTRSQI
jgi:ubiquinone/menaquinone biosynthesis C-methylase UbiE